MARRNAQQSSRRNSNAPRGRRVTSQGGFPGGVQPDLYPMIQQIAHSAQRFYNGQSPYRQFQVNPGGPMNPGANVNPGGPVKSPGPGRKVNPGGPNLPQNKGLSNYLQNQINPGGPDVGVGPGGRWPDWPGGGINPGGPPQGLHNHGGSQHDHPGGGPGHTHEPGGGMPQLPGGDVSGQGRQAGQWPGFGGQQVNPGGPNQPAGGDQGGGQQQQMPPWFNDWLAQNPWISQQMQNGDQPHAHGNQPHAHQNGQQPHDHGQGQGQGGGQQNGGGQGGGGGGNQVPAAQPPYYPTPNPNPPAAGPVTGQPAGFNPTLGNNYGGTFQSTNQYQATNQQPVAGIAQGSFMNPEANDTERFFYDTFANGQTYKPMPTGATGQAPSSYPFQGYAPPPSNVGYFNPGQGWNFSDQSHQPMTWDQYAQAMSQPGIRNDIQPVFKQNVAPSGAQNAWWANPVVTQPGQYDPWVELRNLQQHFGNATPGNLAGNTALGLGNSQGQLDYYRYLAHQAGIPGYAGLTGPLASGYHAGA